MRRRLLNLLTIVSMMVFAAATASWPLSYGSGGRMFDNLPQRTCVVEQCRGRIRVVFPLGRRDVNAAELFPPLPNLAGRGGSVRSPGGTVVMNSRDGAIKRLRGVELLEFGGNRTCRAAAMEEVSAGVRRAGCEWRTGRRSVGPINTDRTPAATFSRWAAVTVPHSYVLLVAGALPGWRAVGAVRRRCRRGAGLCPTCRYDLTGNVSGVCPECGQAA